MTAFWRSVVFLSLVPGSAALGFHDGGVATCAVCHVMHGERDGEIILDGSQPLLVAASATDVCLICHDGSTGVFGQDPLSPPPQRGAGNFVFLLEDNLNDAPDGLVHPIAGEAAGHSIVSFSRGTAPDSRWPQAPGGSFPSVSLGCTSCHDPHGNTNFRHLRGVGPVQGGIYDFVYPAPAASGLDCCATGVSETPQAHTAYLAGMSAWCANCHPNFSNEHGSGFEHPVDDRLEDMGRNYSLYDGDDNPEHGNYATAYLPEVPFEDTQATTSRTAGPDPGSRIMCLSCHRAHASSAPASGRWDFNVALLAADGVVSGSYPLPNPYPGPNQGQLCAKCHLTTPGHGRGPFNP